MTMSPENFKGGGIWNVILNINGAMQAIGLALLVLFFLAGVVQTSANLTDVKRPEHALKLFLRFAIAKGVVTYGLELMMAVFQIVQGVISKIMRTSGLGGASTTKLPNVNHPSHYTDGNIEVIDFIEDKNLSYHLDNAVKYISRAGKKDPEKTAEDLQKAVWCLNRYIELLNKPE